MGEVYQARDVRLNRNVALKVLRDGTAADPERRARLRQEARAIASLSHPSICALYDVGVSGDSDFLVMELLQGETLQERLRRGPMAVREVLQRGAEIADALQFAHRAGILHRDLKPGNVMLTKTGAKLLDFGLARATRSGQRSPAVAERGSTEAMPLTGEGIAVGTIHYMAPEQLAGGELDGRSDIWSLGVTLFEMLTAQRPFEAPSTVGLMTAILKEEPRLGALPSQVPASLRRVLQRCLAKDPDARWQSAGDLANELRWIAEDSSGAQPAAPLGRGGVPWLLGSRWAGWTAAAIAAVALVALTLGRGAMPSNDQDVVRSHIIPPDVPFPSRDDIALSPDGKCLALVLPDSSGVSHLFIRRLDALETVQLGTATAHFPFWSSDSRQVGFVTDENKLVKQSLDGGAAQTICLAPQFASGAWGADHWIVFTTGVGPLLKVKDSGGAPEAATVLDTTRHETTHGYPCFLPDGRHFTYLTAPSIAPSTNRVRVGSTDGSAGWDLMTVHHAPTCDGREWLVFMRDRALLAQRVDGTGRRLLGEPIPMVETPERSGDGADPIALVAGGTLIYHELNDKPYDISWYSRAGAMEELVAATPFVIDPAVSPDGHRAIMRGVQGDETWLVIVDLATREVRRLTSETEWNSWPTWDASGSRVFYSTQHDGQFQIRVMDPENPTSSRLVCTSLEFMEPDYPTANGRSLITGTETSKGTGDDLVLRELAHPETPETLLATAANENCTALIGGGKWFVYSSDESGRAEIYADRFPGLGHRIRLTPDGCSWTARNRHFFFVAKDEIFYMALDGRTLRALRFETLETGVRVIGDKALFVLPAGCRGACPSPDGQRFLVLTPRQAPALMALTLVQNWQRGLVRAR
jgi:Tol biopolymer transport system component